MQISEEFIYLLLFVTESQIARQRQKQMKQKMARLWVNISFRKHCKGKNCSDSRSYLACMLLCLSLDIQRPESLLITVSVMLHYCSLPLDEKRDGRKLWALHPAKAIRQVLREVIKRCQFCIWSFNNVSQVLTLISCQCSTGLRLISNCSLIKKNFLHQAQTLWWPHTGDQYEPGSCLKQQKSSVISRNWI